jgi:hypothetical protein
MSIFEGLLAHNGPLTALGHRHDRPATLNDSDVNLQSWPSLTTTFERPTVEAFGDLSKSLAQFWMRG